MSVVLFRYFRCFGLFMPPLFLNFRKFKVALNPMCRIFLKFAKSCVLSCLSKVAIVKTITVPFLNYKHLKLYLRVFLGGHTVAMVTLLCHDNDNNVFTND